MKKNLFIVYILLISILTIFVCQNVLATKSYGWNNLTSIEYPAKIDSFRPFQVKLTIIDPEIRKYTKEIRTESNCYSFRLMGESTEYIPASVNITPYNVLSHQNIIYNGEKEIVLTLLSSRAAPLEYNGYNDTCSFRFFFIPDEETTKNPPLLKDGRTLDATQQISEVNMYTIRSNYSLSMNLPSGVEKASYGTQTYMQASKTGFQSDGIQYNINAQLMRYGYTLDTDGMASYAGSSWKFDPNNVNYSEHFAMSTKVSYEAGNMFDKDSKIKKLDISSFGKIKVEDAYYRTYSSKYTGAGIPTGKVQVTISFHGQAYLKQAFVNYKFEKIVVTDLDAADSVISSTEQEFVSMAKSYMITTMPIEELTLTADKTKDENKITDPVIFGTIADGDHNPMPFMRLRVYVGRKTFETITTESGDFKIELTGEEIKPEESLSVKFSPSLSYIRDGKNYFRIMYLNPADRTYYLVQLYKNINLTEKNTEIHMVLDETPDPSITASDGIRQWAQIKSMSVMYHHFHESVDFALTKLNANIDYKLPVDVEVGNTQKKTLYSPDDSDILIGLEDSSYSSSNRPKNREYHEFSHHIMYSTYGAWPAGRTDANVKNHDGFLNPNTGDSYLEGFAEFMAMAIAKDAGDKTPEIYASFGSQENNYKPWDSNGYDEEFAVSSLLWDLYDSKNDAGDNFTMSLEDIWKVLKVNRKDFYEYYLAFKQANPGKEKQIDALFIAHGFFANPDIGNKRRDLFEGFRDANGDKNYTLGEFFVDYGANSTALLRYRSGMKIGAAANYERMNRSSTVRIPNAYIKVINPEIRVYTVKVTLKDHTLGDDYSYQVDVRDGLIYLQPLPSGYDADIIVTPYSKDYTSQAPYTTTAAKLISDIQKTTQGYIEAHDFKLKATGTHTDPVYYLPEGVEPTYAYEGDLGDISGLSLKTTDGSNGRSGKSSSAIWIIAVIVVVLIVGLWYFKKNKKHKHRHN